MVEVGGGVCWGDTRSPTRAPGEGVRTSISVMHMTEDLGHVGGGTERDEGRVRVRGTVFQDTGV